MARGRTDADVLKALGHPVRRQVMALLEDGVASPKELAAALGVPLPNVSYHVGILRELGLIKVVRETPRRGAIERHYKTTARSLSVRQVVDWLLAADEARPRGWEARIVELDDDGHRAVRAAIGKLWAEVEKAEKGSVRRKGRSANQARERHGIGVVDAVTGST